MPDYFLFNNYNPFSVSNLYSSDTLSNLTDGKYKDNNTYATHLFTSSFSSLFSRDFGFRILGNDISRFFSAPYDIINSTTTDKSIPDGVRYITALIIGGGGGGGGGGSSSDGNGSAGGGGGCGGISVEPIVVTTTRSLKITIGEGGIGGGNGINTAGADGEKGNSTHIIYNNKYVSYAMGGGGGGKGYVGGGGGAGGAIGDKIGITFTKNVNYVDGGKGDWKGGINVVDPSGDGGYIIYESLFSKSAISNLFLPYGRGGKGGYGDSQAGGDYGTSGSVGTKGAALLLYHY